MHCFGISAYWQTHTCRGHRARLRCALYNVDNGEFFFLSPTCFVQAKVMPVCPTQDKGHEAAQLNKMLTQEVLDMVPGCRFAEARTERLPCPMWSSEESTGPTQDPPIVWGSREPVAQVFHAGHLRVFSISAAPVLALTAALLKAGLWAISRPPAFYPP